MEAKELAPSDLAVKRGFRIAKNSERSYKGALSDVWFKVDRPVLLTGLTFFAPLQKCVDDTQYVLRIERVYQPVPYCCGIFVTGGMTYTIAKFTEFKTKKELELCGDRIRINPRDIIRIESGIWHKIRFSINGPKTPHLDNSRLENLVIYDGEPGNPQRRVPVVKFEFLQGSCQLPEIHFIPS